ncbi:MAG TPA: SMP-30/gluconolactonase/LRE family protein [Roseiarcus sp.]|nr:SMP-30/gluconolactonase/LRE family protein [Roseiarcus sp.]
MSRAARVLCEGIYFGEGPRWRDGRLWFSDFFAHAVKSVSSAGDLRTEFTIDDQPSGLGWTPDGTMLVVSMANRRVLRRSPSGEIGVHADLSGIATFHCNDMAVDSSGRAYVGNFGFDLHHELAARGDQSVLADHKTAKLAFISPQGAVGIASDELHFPNGTVITPDGKTLIVAETLATCLTAFDIGPDGALSGRRIWASTLPRVPDGIALDADGAVWIANALGPECVRISEGGEALDVVATSQNCYAACWAATTARRSSC